MSATFTPATWIALFTLSGAYFIMGVSLMSVIGMLEPMARHFQVSTTQIALLLSVFAITFALVAPIIQVLFGRVMQRTILQYGLCLLAGGAILLAISPNFEMALAARVVMAIGAAATGPVNLTIATKLVPPHFHVRAISVVVGGITLSSVLGVPMASGLSSVWPWQSVFWIIAALALALAALVSRVVPSTGPGEPRSFAQFFGVLSNARTAFAIGTSFLQMAGSFATYALIAVIMMKGYGLTQDWLPHALFAIGVGHLAGTFLSGTFGDRFEVNQLVLVTLVINIVVLIALSFASTPLLGAIAIGIWSVVGSTFQPPQQKRLISLAPTMTGLLFATNASALYVGIATGSLVATVVSEQVGLNALPLASAVLMIGAIFALRISQKSVTPLEQH